MENQKQIYTEVYTVLSKLPTKYLNMIPQDVKKEIFFNANIRYSYAINELLPESKAILIEIIKRYFNEKEITQKIDAYINYNEQIIEKRKGSYNQNDIFKPIEKNVIEDNKLLPIECKKISILDKLRIFIKRFFKKT